MLVNLIYSWSGRPYMCTIKIIINTINSNIKLVGEKHVAQDTIAKQVFLDHSTENSMLGMRSKLFLTVFHLVFDFFFLSFLSPSQYVSPCVSIPLSLFSSLSHFAFY